MPVPCPHRRVFIWPDSQFRIREKRKEFHPLGLPSLGLTCWEAFRIRPGRDSSVAPTTVCLFTETLRNRNEAPRLYRRKQTTTHQRTTRQETMPAVIQTREGVEKHIETHSSADNTELGSGTPRVSLSSGTRFTLPNGVHCSPDLGLGEEVSFPQSRLPSSMLAGLGLTPARTANPFPHGKLSLMPDTFLTSSRASSLHWTFPDLPEHRCYYLSFSPFIPKSILPRSRDPRRAPKCSARSLNPRLGKKTPQDNATCNRGIYY